VAQAAAIAGDWGTSNLRLFLCSVEGEALASKAGPGAAAVDMPFPRVLSSLVADWQREHGELPIVLCGMVGSSIGWTQVPYVACPASAGQIAARCVALEGGRVRIVPGLSCTNRLNAPDVMRGEETQILGALQLDASLRQGQRLVCLPGTHTKWVAIKDGAVTDFLTAPAGELYSLLAHHSVLVTDTPGGQRPTAVGDGAGFARGLEQVRLFPEADLVQRVFQCRSRRLMGNLAPQDAPAFLSGLLIGSDAQSALRLMTHGTAANVHVIGTPQLTRLYAQALTAFGAAPHEMDGEAAALAGLMQIHRATFHSQVAHEA
jgi:2-dehydro-3-deoxygalactonokinase